MGFRLISAGKSNTAQVIIGGAQWLGGDHPQRRGEYTDMDQPAEAPGRTVRKIRPTSGRSGDFTVFYPLSCKASATPSRSLRWETSKPRYR